MNDTFTALLEEAQFTREILGAGVTDIGRANYARTGLYFQSFTNLSTGLERMGKLCLIVDYYINNDGALPNKNYIKDQIGHDLKLLYTKSIDVAKKHAVKFRFLNNLDDKIYCDIIDILTRFAKGDRYSNINLLVTQSRTSDPIYDWSQMVDRFLYDTRVSDNKKRRIEYNAQIIGEILEPFSLVNHTSETRQNLTTVSSASRLTGMTEAVSRYRQLYILQILRYWTELLSSIGYKAMEMNRKENIPFFSEIFAVFYSEDRYFLERKTFTTDY